MSNNIGHGLPHVPTLPCTLQGLVALVGVNALSESDVRNWVNGVLKATNNNTYCYVDMRVPLSNLTESALLGLWGSGDLCCAVVIKQPTVNVWGPATGEMVKGLYTYFENSRKRLRVRFNGNHGPMDTLPKKQTRMVALMVLMGIACGLQPQSLRMCTRDPEFDSYMECRIKYELYCKQFAVFGNGDVWFGNETSVRSRCDRGGGEG